MVRARTILSLIGYGYSALEIRNHLQRHYSISKQLLSEDFRRMVYNGWILDLDRKKGYKISNKFKQYGLTESGRTVLAGYEKHDNAHLVKMENHRHKSIIQNETWLKQFLSLESYGFERRDLKNQKTYYGNVEGMTVQVSIGKKATLIMTPRPLFTSSVRKGRVRIQQTLLDFVNMLNERWLFNLTPPIMVKSHGQIAISGRFPQEMLRRSGGAQIRIEKDYGTVMIDASPPDKFPHVEMPAEAPEVADDLLDTPKHYKAIMKKLDEIESNNMIRDQAFGKAISIIEKDSAAITRLTDLITGQDKSGQNQVKQMNRDSLNMFQ